MQNSQCKSFILMKLKLLRKLYKLKKIWFIQSNCQPNRNKMQFQNIFYLDKGLSNISSSIIVVSFKIFGCIDGLLFYNQGTDSVLKLNEQIQLLIEQQRFNVDDLKEQLILHYQNNDEFLWDKIFNRNYAFNKQEIIEIKNQIENVQISDFHGILQSETLSIFGVAESSKIPNLPSGQHDYSKEKEKSYFECAYQYQSQ
ncbi:unnamed protein product (macronuclear) [Paramecium tetraurelia]|uniref:Uncharacterized protein n=1 Tax=Paramecium tetraurelia TaxID=5888 RepID=A0EB79_PARTE|nr:uncharacterized protein GSPATT00025280001 [Paramecium tetraurelia]CAK92546.1 unnamed protein product [Paramecium tetraurelia]|eukprot:XP_001459943.1 hypothetical protein (macronuclear) [Paramecium tetraurelia strain d4-2]